VGELDSEPRSLKF